MGWAVALVVVATTALVGCSGDDDAGSAGDTTTTTAAPLVESATVERVDGDTLTISVQASDGAGDLTVLASEDPDSFDGAEEVGTIAAGSGEAEFDDPNPSTRTYFAVADGTDIWAVAAERALPLEGQPNFRDLGGYESADGRHVRWGQIYRSGELDELTEADLAYLDGIGVALVCDLRAPTEIADAPDQLPEGTPTDELPIVDDATDPALIRDQVLAGDISGLGPELLIEGNQAFVTDFSEEFGGIVQRVMDPANRPTLVHCSAGKDRAGYASAVILWALGVPTDTVMEDYLLTNTYNEASNQEALEAVGQIVDDPAPIEALLEARPEYLQAAIDTIESEYGDVDTYLTEGLGFTEEEIEAFRDDMLQ